MRLVAAALLAATTTATSLDASSLLPELERFEAVAPCGLPVGRYYTLAKYGAILSIVGEAAVRDGVVEVAIAARDVAGGRRLLVDDLGWPEAALAAAAPTFDCAGADVSAVARGPSSAVACDVVSTGGCAWRASCAAVEAGRHAVEAHLEGFRGAAEPNGTKYPREKLAWEPPYAEIKWRTDPAVPGAPSDKRRNNYDGPLVRGAPEVWCGDRCGFTDGCAYWTQEGWNEKTPYACKLYAAVDDPRAARPMKRAGSVRPPAGGRLCRHRHCFF